ncbi:putative transposase Ptta/En/Spm plant [Arabidopsis thaliana x Arabidopsis arenosa]|uniref:Putative transposase Ptta/En/Spm plant n=1 Tax=Arabidopsis thaliana x Arabidopsis arenosa TaxID=1240361 RepID=A0A8T1ZKR4_9BRAS|nr:putative transposase Ptta/En/Spm plant [Arabidopsis thaliana x Arabidopsis arenosa]
MGVMLAIKMQSDFTESSQAITGFGVVNSSSDHADNRNSNNIRQYTRPTQLDTKHWVWSSNLTETVNRSSAWSSKLVEDTRLRARVVIWSRGRVGEGEGTRLGDRVGGRVGDRLGARLGDRLGRGRVHLEGHDDGARPRGKSARGRGGKSTNNRGARVYHGQNPKLIPSGVGTSSHSSNPSSATQSVSRPSQYPPATQVRSTPALRTSPAVSQQAPSGGSQQTAPGGSQQTPRAGSQQPPPAGSQQPPPARRKQPLGRQQQPSSSRQQQPPPRQYQPSSSRQQQPPPRQPQPPPRQDPEEQQVIPPELNLNDEDDYEEEVDDYEEEVDEVPEEQNGDQNVDYQEMLDRLLALPGRQHLPLLSQNPIPGVETLWFNRHKGKLSRVIAGIFRRKFDGPYFSWKVTPIPIRERYFRSFARKYNWDVGITELVREGFLVIAKKRLKGIVSQAKQSGVQPPWIRNTLWAEMWVYWKTEDAIERSENASQCRNSDRGGLGVHKHLAGQKSFVQVHQEMEEELKRPVSLGEVFMATHTRADGSFVDQKAKEVAEAYAKGIEDRMSELDEEGPQNSTNSSEHSTDRILSIDEKNEIFLKCTHKDDKGTPYGLGSLVETLNKGKRKESYASSSTATIVELQDQLRRKISEHEAENARRDEEHRQSQSRISSLEKLLVFMKDKDPELAAFLSSASTQPQPPIQATTTAAGTLPTTTAAGTLPTTTAAAAAIPDATGTPEDTSSNL